MKKIEDYVGLYPQGQIWTGSTGLATNLGLFYEVDETNPEDIKPLAKGISLFFKTGLSEPNKLAVGGFDECQLALRKLSSMTEQEALYIATEVYFNQFEMDPNEIRVMRYENGNWLIYYREVGTPQKVCIASSGKIGIYRPEVQKFVDINYQWAFELTPYLLSRQIDIYGLIEAGIAVDINNLPKT